MSSSIRAAQACASAYSAGTSTPRSRATFSYFSTILKRVEAGGDGGRRVHHPQRIGDVAERLAVAELLRLHRAALDEVGDDRRRVGQHRRHRRRDADLGGGGVRRELRAAIDAEERGVLAGHPDHVVGPAERRAVVAVRDARRRGAQACRRTVQAFRSAVGRFVPDRPGGLDVRPVFRLVSHRP